MLHMHMLAIFPFMFTYKVHPCVRGYIETMFRPYLTVWCSQWDLLEIRFQLLDWQWLRRSKNGFQEMPTHWQNASLYPLSRGLRGDRASVAMAINKPLNGYKLWNGERDFFEIDDWIWRAHNGDKNDFKARNQCDGRINRLQQTVGKKWR